MHCNPACWGCTAAGACPREAGTAPAAPASQPHRWTPDRLTGQIAGCGHRIEILPIIRDIFSLKEVWCTQCIPNRWVKPPAKKQTTTTTPTGDDQGVIPF